MDWCHDAVVLLVEQYLVLVPPLVPPLVSPLVSPLVPPLNSLAS